MLKKQRRAVKHILFVFIAAIMLVCTFSSAQSVLAAKHKVGDIISFGSYPQSQVVNGATIKQLNSLAKSWKSFGLYNTDKNGKTQKSDYFKYTDVTYNGEKYRGLKFYAYRTDPSYYEYQNMGSTIPQKENGYKKNTVYWFKYETVKWSVLDVKKGVVVSVNVLDSSEFSSSLKTEKYSKSYLRSWLNSTFYDTAFTEAQKNQIKNHSKTKDKVSVISNEELPELWVFDEETFEVIYVEPDISRCAVSTKYARCMGVSAIDETGYSNWWLRDEGGMIMESLYEMPTYIRVDSSNVGVRPAICLDLNNFNASSGSASASNKKNSYDVRFDKNSSSAKGEMSTVTFKRDKSEKLPANSFTREGYHLKGWAKSKDGKVVYKNSQSVKNIASKNSTITLYAVWEINTYSIKFSANCKDYSGNIKAISCTYGKSKKLPSNNFKRKGYTFEGWAKSKDGNVVYKNKQSVKNVTNDHNTTVTLYAKWTPNSYKIKFDKNSTNAGGLLMGDIVCDYGKKYNLPENTYTRKNYHFIGWAEAKDGKVKYKDGEKISNITSADNKTVTLYAVWEKDYCKVEFYPNITDTSGKMDSIRVNFDEKKKLPENKFIKTGYHFVGWSTSRNGKVVYKNKAEFSKTLKKSIETQKLYAKWEKNVFDVKLDGNGGSDWKPGKIAVTYSVKKNLPQNKFTLKNYNFLGWSKTPEGNVEFKDAADVSGFTVAHKGSITLYAVWGYKVTYNPNGGTGEITVDYVKKGTQCRLPEVLFKRENHYIREWDLSWDASENGYKPGSVTGDLEGKNVTLYAVWEEYEEIIAPVDLSSSHWYALTYENHAPNGEPFQKYATDWNSAADVGAPVRAIADGTVDVSIVNNGSIRIRHSVVLPMRSGAVIEAYAWFSWYGHMRDIVPKGTVVKKGDIIGYISNVATSNDHLHFAIYAANSAWGKPSYGISPYWTPGELSNADIYKDNVYGAREPAWLYYDFLLSDKEMPGYVG